MGLMAIGVGGKTDALRADILSSCLALGLSRLTNERPFSAGEALHLLHGGDTL
jgi:hypothetical protein